MAYTAITRNLNTAINTAINMAIKTDSLGKFARKSSEYSNRAEGGD
jgi:hypothetical protein